MDNLLMAVTVMSLLMASAMAVVVVHLLRDERRRSDARVAALMELAAHEAGEPVPVERDIPLRVHTQARVIREATPPPRRDIADLELRSDATQVTGVGDLFVAPERSSPWGARLAVAAAIAILATAVFMLPRVVGSRGSAQSATAAAAPPSAPAATPMELLSLTYAQEAGRLTVSGVVQNPRGAAPLARVVATAFAFGPDGSFLASGRAPLDFTTLGPGDESPFVVTVPVTGEVGRYRIGFRTEDGAVIAHVDRRSEAGTLAQK